MADRYWVGGTGAWNASNTTNWSASSGGAGGASVPTSADNVIFDNNSDAGADYTVTISGTRLCLNFTVSSQDFVMTLAGSGTPVLSISGSVNVNPVTSGRYAGSGVIEMQFVGSGSQTISVTNTSPSSQLTAGSCSFANAAGTWTLNSNFTVVGAGFTLTNGTVALGSNQLTYQGSTLASIAAGNLNFGSGTFLLTNANITFSSSTVTAGTGSLTISRTAAVTFTGGANTFYQVTLGNASTQSITINDPNTFTNLIFGGTNAFNRLVAIQSNQTITGILNFSGASSATPHLARTYIYSGTFNFARTLSIGTAQNVSNIDFQDITVTGTASPISGSSVGNRGGNSGITFTAAKTCYWVGGTGNWNSSAATRWAASSGGAAAAANYPLAQDTAVIDNSSGAGTLTVDGLSAGVAVGPLNMSARTTAFTLDVSSNIYIFGNWSNGSGITLSGTAGIFFDNRSPASITSAGKTFTQFITVRCVGTTLSLSDNFVCNYSFSSSPSITHGTFNLNTFNASVDQIALSAGATLAIGSGTLTVSGSGISFNMSPSGTVTGAGKISMTSASAKTFAGGIKTYGHLENAGAGALTINGQNTFTTISNSVQPTTFTFPSGASVTVTNFNVSGTPGNLVTINATSTGNATLSKASGAVVVSYCSITKSTATGGATWSALVADGNVNAGSNSGWNFGVSSNGLFFGSNF